VKGENSKTGFFRRSISLPLSTSRLAREAGLGSGGGIFYTGPGSEDYVIVDNIQLTINLTAPLPERPTAQSVAPMLASLMGRRSTGRRTTLS